jgi:Cdc6-like AAA superfamily ATPase
MVLIIDNNLDFRNENGEIVTIEGAYADFFNVTKLQRRYAYRFDGVSFVEKAKVNSNKTLSWGLDRGIVEAICLSEGDKDNPYLFARRKRNGVKMILPVFEDGAPTQVASIMPSRPRPQMSVNAPKPIVTAQYTPVVIDIKTLDEDESIDPRMCEVMPILDQALGHFICVDRNPDGTETYGIPRSTVNVVTGQPGVGKTSNMLNLALKVKEANADARLLFVSAEMNRRDLMKLCQLMPEVKSEVKILHAEDYYADDEAPSFTDALNAALKQGWDFILLDSFAEIQNIVRDEMNISSDKKAEGVIINMLRDTLKGENERNIYPAIYAIQQMTKSGDPCGSNRLIHMITSHLHISRDKKNGNTPCMMFKKNRQGDTDNKLYFGFGNGIEYDTERYESEVEIANSMSNVQKSDMNMNDFLDTLFESDEDVNETPTREVNVSSNTDTRNMNVDAIAESVIEDAFLGEDATIQDVYSNIYADISNDSRPSA